MVALIRFFMPLLLLLLPLDGAIAADQPLNRAEVTTVKRKLVAVIEAIGAPQGYVRAEENFSLPTSISTMTSGAFHAVSAGADLRFDGGAEKQSKRSEKEIEEEYRRKILEAQASGDYQALATLTQEMMQKAGQAQLAAEDARREPVAVNIEFNQATGATIDPDGVVFERPGVIALKERSGRDEEKLRVRIFCDPVHLKQTETLSEIRLYDDPDPGVEGKTTVRNLVIEFNGPAAVVEAWAKQVDIAKAMAQIGGK
ncbi:hypothetical protein JCM30471_18630 [Desulfuromonas carbonis]|uniref:hypothetical protein n=1 Tax=Desulfuromonas sp. DDH964 TaxID=1823759 RepID=UPI00078BBE78|nr:hypothetical protein [Desulfuromonas sp. DDH964]AMV73446.1 hypothetical protein DBW_3139 [Desulfuromonas sp. DDH964]